MKKFLIITRKTNKTQKCKAVATLKILHTHAQKRKDVVQNAIRHANESMHAEITISYVHVRSSCICLIETSTTCIHVFTGGYVAERVMHNHV